MLQVLIVEDEVLAATRLRKLLLEGDREVNILAEIDSVSAAVDWLNSNEADLIFMDIHLADGQSFQIFDRVSIETPIIFITAYDQYAIQAFELNSIAYLLKPFEAESLYRAIDKYEQYFRSDSDQLLALKKALTQEPSFRQRFLVYSGDKIRTVEVGQVAYFMADQKLVFLLGMDGRRHAIDQSLDKLEPQLDPQRFFRINRQFIIGYEAIRNMYAYSKGRVKIELEPKSEKEAIVSIEKASRFKQWLNQ